VGDKTTKMASCLPCALFHVRRRVPADRPAPGPGESWLPFYPKDPTETGYSRPVDEAIRSTNERWYCHCGQHLTLGVAILAGASFADGRAGRLPLLLNVLKREEPGLAANLILDAITVHGHEVDRMPRTLA
jgi:hypothetical protein